MLEVSEGHLTQLRLLFERYHRRVYNYFVKATMDPEEGADLTQNVFVRVMRYRHTYRQGHRFETWLFSIARNVLMDHFQKRKIQKASFQDAVQLPDGAEEDAEKWHNEQRLHRALALLPPEKRDLLVLSKFEGLRYEQIAEITGLSVSAIKVQVHRTIRQLRVLYFEKTE